MERALKITAIPRGIAVPCALAALAIAGIIYLLSVSYIAERRAYVEPASLPGQCLDLSPTVTARIVRVVPYDRSSMLQVEETDASGGKSVAFVPTDLYEHQTRTCR